MASIMKRGDSYSVRYKYKDHSGKPCEGWESFKTRKEAQERKITVEKELLDGTFLVPDTITVEEMLYKWIPIQSMLSTQPLQHPCHLHYPKTFLSHSSYYLNLHNYQLNLKRPYCRNHNYCHYYHKHHHHWHKQFSCSLFTLYLCHILSFFKCISRLLFKKTP